MTLTLTLTLTLTMFSAWAAKAEGVLEGQGGCGCSTGKAPEEGNCTGGTSGTRAGAHLGELTLTLTLPLPLPLPLPLLLTRCARESSGKGGCAFLHLEVWVAVVSSSQ